MVALVAADVTVTITESRIVGRKRRYICTVTFGDGAKTYPAGGVPMPSAQSFGLIRNLDFLNVLDEVGATAALWLYDKTNSKLKAYVEQAVGTNSALVEASTALAPAAQTFQVEAVGW